MKSGQSGQGGHAGEPAGPGHAHPQPPPISPELIDDARDDTPDADCAHTEDTRDDQLAALEARIAELESQLASANDALSASERRREIERLLSDADAVDIETAALLTEAAVSAMDPPDVARAVQDLRRRKPFLFPVSRTRPAPDRGAAMSPAPRPSTREAHADHLDTLAEHARASGDRRALLRYLRQRRAAH